MRVATWNVNGLRARFDFVTHWLRARAPDVVGLQELKLSDEQFPHEAFAELGYRAETYGQKAWNGVAVLTREPAEVLQRGLPGQEAFGARLLTVQISGLVFTTLFALGLLMASLYPTSVSIQTIVLGNILAIADEDAMQVVIIAVVSFAILAFIWKDLMVTFFDETHAKSIGVNTWLLKIVFFTLLSACTVAALQTVGACLVIAMVVTPGATAYLLTDRFSRLILIAIAIGAGTSFVGAYLSYFVNGATGGVIVTLQTLIFLGAFYFAPRHGVLAARRKRDVVPEAAA